MSCAHMSGTLQGLTDAAIAAQSGGSTVQKQHGQHQDRATAEPPSQGHWQALPDLGPTRILI